MNSDTIAAIATPSGQGGVGIIRVSGENATKIAEKISGLCPAPRYAYYGTFSDKSENTIDTGLTLFFKKPFSFTGEDVVEFHAHGGPVVLDILLKEILQHDVRPARAGEFTERAFLNDKIDLAQAEAIADLIAADSEQAARAAMRSMQGEFSAVIHQLVEDLIGLRIYVESALDFPEEEIDCLSDENLKNQLAELNQTMKNTLRKTQTGVVLAQGISIAIIGKPNAGKSSLLNCLTEEDSAIISDVAGTTRDVVKEDVVIAGIPVRLIDTAGIHETDNPIEQQGINRALKMKDQADVVLHVMDGQAPVKDQIIQDVKYINIINKNDVLHPDNQNLDNVIHVSAKNQQGIDKVRDAIVQQVNLGKLNENTFTARQRHIEQLKTTQAHIDEAEQQLQYNQGELSAEELRLAQNALNEITGEFSSDDLLGEIFSSFCIGK